MPKKIPSRRERTLRALIKALPDPQYSAGIMCLAVIGINGQRSWYTAALFLAMAAGQAFGTVWIADRDHTALTDWIADLKPVDPMRFTMTFPVTEEALARARETMRDHAKGSNQS